jgi:hypothetical protein
MWTTHLSTRICRGPEIQKRNAPAAHHRRARCVGWAERSPNKTRHPGTSPQVSTTGWSAGRPPKNTRQPGRRHVRDRPHHRRMTRDLTRPGELSNVWNAWKRDRLRRPGRPPPQADETDVELFLMNLMKSYCLSDISPSWTHYRKDPGCGLCCVTERYVPRLGYLKERGRTPRRVVFRRHKAVADVSQ